ncbi:hypothetical protein EW145_g5842, partial [Phellinidium pouzarii]
LFNLPSTSAATAYALLHLFPKYAYLNSPSPATPTAHASPATAFEIMSYAPTPAKMFVLREECGGRRPGEEDSIWAVFNSHEEIFFLSLPVYSVLYIDPVIDIWTSSQAYTALTLSGPLSVAPALECDLEPFGKLRRFELNKQSAYASALQSLYNEQRNASFPPSPTSPISSFEYSHAPGAEQVYENESVPNRQPSAISRGCAFPLSSNPPNPRSAFRHGDWMLVLISIRLEEKGGSVVGFGYRSGADGAARLGRLFAVHPLRALLTTSARMALADVAYYTPSSYRHSRNVICISCAAPRPQNGTHSPGCNNNSSLVSAAAAATSRLASPRFANMGSSALANANQQAVYMTPMSMSHQQHLVALEQLRLAAKQSPSAQHPLLTPSGRALAVGGKVQNISTDPLAPCIMFWPDNEPLPDVGQIRPAALASVHQPPIMNTGNKGPIEQQPGDWNCRKCEYLNWRRRRVCQTCYPYADGNGDSVSATMHAERLALLAAVYAQAQATQMNFQGAQSALQLHQRSMPAQPTAHEFPSTSVPASNPSYASSSAYSGDAGRSHFSSAPARPNGNVAVNSRLANHSYAARRANSTPDMASGSIVYQTPPSPAAPRGPTSLSSAFVFDDHERYSSMLSHANIQTGPLLPSFLKHEVQPVRSTWGTRTPASLSPASSSSADLSFDEHDELNSPISTNGVAVARPFYAQTHRTGSVSGSGSSTGSTSSLTLGGSSIWSLDRDEDKAWNSGAFADLSLGGPRSRPTSAEAPKPKAI